MDTMDMVTEEPPPLTELVIALEQATLMAKQLPTTADQSQIVQIYSALHSAHHRLSSFLSQTSLQLNHSLPPPPPAAENSVTSPIGNDQDIDDGDNEPMQVGDGEDEAEEEQISRATIDRVEERMRECFIRTKRAKRPLSPTAAAAAELQLRSYENEFARGSAPVPVPAAEFDPQGTRVRSLDLIYQFHG